MEIKELTGKKSWPFRYTAPWISVLTSIFVLLESMLFAGLGAIQGSGIVSSALRSMQFQNMVGDDSIPQVIRNMGSNGGGNS